MLCWLMVLVQVHMIRSGLSGPRSMKMWGRKPLRMPHLVGVFTFLAIVRPTSALYASQARQSSRRFNRTSLLAVGGEPASGSVKEPMTLADYCKGAPAETTEKSKMTEEARVEADWRGFGTLYPGKIVKVNSASVEILYDDGWSEEIKDTNGDGEYSKIKPLDTDTDESETKKVKPVDDPICDLVDEVDATKVKIEDIQRDIALWTAGKRAKVSGKQMVIKGANSGRTAPAPAPAPQSSGAVPSPAPAVAASDSQADELEKLKQELAEVDERIRELQQTVDANSEVINAAVPQDPEAAARNSIDDLIAEYKRRLNDRKRQLKELEEKLAEQEQQLAVLGELERDLNVIDKEVDELEAVTRQLKRKRDEFEKAGDLDPELRAYVDKLIEEANALREKVDALLEAEKAAEEAEAAAAKAELEAAKDDDADEASKHKQATEATRAAMEREEKVFEAAQSVGEELEKMDSGAEKLNTGVHPHGAKWWRFRYEHSFIEALLMIWILVFMLIWEEVFTRLRIKANKAANIEGKSHNIALEGTMYIHWVEMVALELMACLAVFVTVWIIAKVELFDYFPMILKGDDHMHLPNDGPTYRRLAVDEVVILAMALVIYYSVTLSIVYQATEKLSKWTAYESTKTGPADTASLTGTQTLRRMATVGAGQDEFFLLKSYFIAFMTSDPDTKKAVSDWEEKNHTKVTEDDFPFWLYLRLNVRMTVDELYIFGWPLWLTICLTFAFLCFLHRYMHMGYIRIMLFFLAVQAGLCLFMLFAIRHVNQEVAAMQEKDISAATPKTKSRTQSFLAAAEDKVIFILQYSLFFLGYGASRMICQDWMWELHFWPVVGICCLLVLLTLVYATLLAPMIPTFAAAMALPPFVDSSNSEQVVQTLELDRVASQGGKA